MGMGMGVAGMIINNSHGSFPHSLLSTSKVQVPKRSGFKRQQTGINTQGLKLKGV